jgi:hypothetical protein
VKRMQDFAGKRAAAGVFGGGGAGGCESSSLLGKGNEPRASRLSRNVVKVVAVLAAVGIVSQLVVLAWDAQNLPAAPSMLLEGAGDVEYQGPNAAMASRMTMLFPVDSPVDIHETVQRGSCQLLGGRLVCPPSSSLDGLKEPSIPSLPKFPAPP